MADRMNPIVLYRLSAESLDAVRAPLEAGGYSISVIDDIGGYNSHLKANPASVVLLDADALGPELVPILYDVGSHKTACAMVLGSVTESDRIVAAVRAGAIDYIVRDTEDRYRQQLVPRIKRALHHLPGADAVALAAQLSQLVNALDHDARNPVSNILGYVDLLRDPSDHGLSEEQMGFLARIEANCNTLLNLLQHFAAVSADLATPASSDPKADDD